MESNSHPKNHRFLLLKKPHITRSFMVGNADAHDQCGRRDAIVVRELHKTFVEFVHLTIQFASLVIDFDEQQWQYAIIYCFQIIGFILKDGGGFEVLEL